MAREAMGPRGEPIDGVLLNDHVSKLLKTNFISIDYASLCQRSFSLNIIMQGFINGLKL